MSKTSTFAINQLNKKADRQFARIALPIIIICFSLIIYKFVTLM